jgi:hypothetical protein
MTRRMKDPIFRAEQRDHLFDPHVAPINRMVDELSRPGHWMPYVAPAHGGVDARMLFLLRDPGPRTADPDRANTGFLCVENDDQSAKRFCGLLERAGIAVRETLPWDAYPWFINKHPSRDQMRDGLVPLRRLLSMVQDLRVVVLMGKAAEASWFLLEAADPELAKSVPVLRTRHPSSQAFISKVPGQSALWREEQAEVMDEAGRILGGRA